jgi:hypothetical protein
MVGISVKLGAGNIGFLPKLKVWLAVLEVVSHPSSAPHKRMNITFFIIVFSLSLAS